MYSDEYLIMLNKIRDIVLLCMSLNQAEEAMVKIQAIIDEYLTS